MEYHSVITKNEILPFAVMWVDVETVVLNEVSQRRRNIIQHHFHAEFKKK